MPSKFSIRSSASNDEIWEKIMQTLTNQEKTEADKTKSIVYEPYFGSKEITVKRSDSSNIAFASLSEVHKSENEWAVYRED